MVWTDKFVFAFASTRMVTSGISIRSHPTLPMTHLIEETGVASKVATNLIREAAALSGIALNRAER